MAATPIYIYLTVRIRAKVGAAGRPAGRVLARKKSKNMALKDERREGGTGEEEASGTTTAHAKQPISVAPTGQKQDVFLPLDSRLNCVLAVAFVA